MRLSMLWATLRLMSRIPVPEKWADGVEFRQLARGVPWFVPIGALIGGLAALVALVVSQTGGGMYVGAVAYVLALVLLTGGFHLDGLADTCDGIFSARSRERMLEIMKDSRLGTFGGLALVFSILIKVSAVIGLAHLPASQWFTLLICARLPVARRWCWGCTANAMPARAKGWAVCILARSACAKRRSPCWAEPSPSG